MALSWLFAHASERVDAARELLGDKAALGDLVPSVLAFLDFESTRRLSHVCRDAARSSIRAWVLQRSVLQLSATSFHVHELMRCMALRDQLRAVEIRDCLLAPQWTPDMATLLAAVQRVKFSDQPMLEREVLDEVENSCSTARRKMGDAAFVRHVRRRLNKEHRAEYRLVEQPHVAYELIPWLHTLPASLVELDFGSLQIDDLACLQQFPHLKKLRLNAGSNVASANFLQPLANATSLEELVISRLDRDDCSELAALTSMRKIELRCALLLRDVEFLRKMPMLESVVLAEMTLTDLSPLQSLVGLSKLTLDSFATSSAVSFGELASLPSPVFPKLESLQVLFTHVHIEKLLPHCPCLVQLHVCTVEMSTWTPLASLTNLECVAVNVDNVDNWIPHASLPHLRQLALETRRGSISSRCFTNGWACLRTLITPPWDDYSSLVDSAISLKELHLLGWRSRDSSSLATLKNAECLEKLRIAFLPGPVELSTLGELHQLRSLELWSAPIITIDFLRGMSNLVELRLPRPFQDGVAIIDFAPLMKLENLQSLDLSGRREFKNASLAYLEQLTTLKNLFLAGSGVTPSVMQRLCVRYNMLMPYRSIEPHPMLSANLASCR